MSWGQTGTVCHEDSTGCAIRQSPYSLESLSLSQGRSNKVLTPRVGQLPKPFKGEWPPWSMELRLEGHIA
jgi:hypothetical protein